MDRMGRALILLTTLIILLTVYSSHGCNTAVVRIAGRGVGSALKVGVKATGSALKVGAKATGGALKVGAKATGSVLKVGAKATGSILKGGAKVTGKALAKGANVLIKAPGKLFRYAKNNPFTAANTLTTLSTCVASATVMGRDTCRGSCLNIKIQIEEKNSSIAEAIHNMENDVQNITILIDETLSLINMSKNISFYFDKLGDIINETMTEHERSMGIATIVEATFNDSKRDDMARDEHVEALSKAVELLTQNLVAQQNILRPIDYSVMGASLGGSLLGFAFSYGSKKYAYSNALKVNDGFRYFVSKEQILKTLGGKSHRFYDDFVYNSKGQTALKWGNKANKIKTITKRIGNGIMLAGTAICASQIGVQLKNEADRVYRMTNTLNTLGQLQNNLTNSSISIKSMLINVTMMAENTRRQISEEYERMFTFAADRLCNYSLNSNTTECRHFNEHGCNLNINKDILQFTMDLKSLNEVIRNTYHYFLQEREHIKLKEDQKKRAREAIELYHNANIDAQVACTLLQSILYESADEVCDELYNSGLYTDLATWSSWTDGDCSETDCKMTQQRTCSQGADCIGSHNRTVSCTSPCVPDQGRRMDEAFKEMMVAHC